MAVGKKRRRIEIPAWLQFIHTSRFVSACIGVVALAFLIAIIVFREESEEHFLTQGQMAPRPILAQIAFNYPDEEATRTARKAAAESTPPVYRIGLQDIRRDADLFGSQLDELKNLNINKIPKSERERLAAIWNQRLGATLDAADMARLIMTPKKQEIAQAVRSIAVDIARAGVARNEQFVNPDLNINTFVDDGSGAPPKFELKRPTDFLSMEAARTEYSRRLRAEVIREEKDLLAIEKATLNILRANITYNERLTEKMREANREKVQPSMVNYSVGDTIIMRNERVNKRHLAVLKVYSEAKRVSNLYENLTQRLWGKAGIVCLLFLGGVMVLRFQQFGGRSTSNREYALLATIMVLQVGISRGILYFADTFDWPSPGLVPYLLMPAFGPMFTAILTNTRRGNVVALLSSFFLAMLVENNFQVLIYSVVTGIAGVYMCRGVRRRFQITVAGLGSGLAGLFCAAAFAFNTQIDAQSALWHGVAAMSAGLITSLAINSILPVFEWIFKVTTDLRWLELTDLNHPLLRRMFTEAPGTYPHSLSVANLSEAGAEAIGANSLQARVCSLFHDIGKLVKPEYFAENIRGKESPHDNLAPHMSALIIMAHVKEGVDLAMKHGLGREIIDVIKEHHGTSRLAFFYHRAKRQEQDAIEGSKIMQWPEEDVPRVDEGSYRYPGPKPQTRESGIIMLADAVEGASRSMVNPTPQKIEHMIREIVQSKLEDGQLDECQLMMQDLNKIIDAFTFTLVNMLHARISYPKDEDKPEKSSQEFPARAAS